MTVKRFSIHLLSVVSVLAALALWVLFFYDLGWAGNYLVSWLEGDGFHFEEFFKHFFRLAAWCVAGRYWYKLGEWIQEQEKKLGMNDSFS